MNEKDSNPIIKPEPAPIMIPEIEQAHEAWFAELSKLEEGDIIFRADCKFCNHRLRAQAEQKWEETHNYSMVKRFFEDNWQEGEPKNWHFTNIQGHLVRHYERQARQIMIREYGDRIRAMLNYKMNRDQQLEMLATSLAMKYVEIGADDSLDEIKATDTQIKITKMLLEIMVMQAKLKGELSTVEVLSNKFKDIWIQIITGEKNPEIKAKLSQYLETFREEMSQEQEL